MNELALAAAGLGGAGALALGWASLIERRWFALRHQQLAVLDHPGTLKVLHLSDLHLLGWQRDKMRFVEGLAELEPDLVVATGDLLGHPNAIDACVSTLRGFAFQRPALLVLGSNDFFAPRPRNPLAYLGGPSGLGRRQIRLETDRMVAGLVEGGWTLMDNQRQTVATSVGTIDVAGLGDPHIRRDRPDAIDWTPPDLESDTPPVLRLGLVHAPYRRALEQFTGHGYGLVLAGHTHGGQVRLPGVGALVTNCDLPTRQARGASRLADDAWLHVSAGLGTSMYAPVRFFCRPEATLLTLTPRKAP